MSKQKEKDRETLNREARELGVEIPAGATHEQAEALVIDSLAELRLDLAGHGKQSRRKTGVTLARIAKK